MGIGKRIGRIIKSNVNELLSAAEDPEKQLGLLVTEMEDSLRLAKQQLVQQLATEKRLQRQLDEADELAKLWAGKAQQAVDAGEDELARQALRKKRNYEELADEYDKQLFEQQSVVDELRAQYKQLEARLAEARRRQSERGVARVRRERGAASDAARAATAPRRVDTSALVNRSAFDKFDEMAEKVEDLEARTEAQRELSDLLAPEDKLARDIDAAGPRAAAGRRRTEEADLQVDIELEEMRRRAQAPGETPGRRSRRREADEPLRPAPEEPADDRPDDDEGGWGRRVEL